MSTTVKKSSAPQIELPEAGNYPAICTQLVMIGTITETYREESREVDKVMITWELPTEKAVFKEGDEPKPFVVSKFFNNTSDERGNLFKWLTNWSPKINKDNIDKFDLKLVLDQKCLLTINHKEKKDGNKRLEATGIASVPKGMQIPERTNEIKLFDVEDFDQEKFNEFPEFIQEMIVSSKEFQASGLSKEKVMSLAKEAKGDNGSSAPDEKESMNPNEAANDAFGDDAPADGGSEDKTYF